MTAPEPAAPRPDRPIFLRARWQWLAMLNYEVDPAVLVDRLPAGTELEILGWQDGWYRVATGDAEGWVPNDRVDLEGH